MYVLLNPYTAEIFRWACLGSIFVFGTYTHYQFRGYQDENSKFTAHRAWLNCPDV
jgi:hypothetical protein